jgi:HK97 gp10 family phage protein
MTEAAKANAQALTEAAKRDAPFDETAPAGALHLRDTIKYYAVDGSGGLIWRVVAGNIREQDGMQNARWQEFGTVDRPAQPFFFSNYRVMKPRFSARMSRAMRKGIKEAG